MKISLKKAVFDDCAEIQKMQELTFADLLKKYKDYDTNPASESLEKIEFKFNQEITDYHFIMGDDVKVGVVRVVKLSKNIHRISPIFILPEFQNKGYAQMALAEVELLYPNIREWHLDTLKQAEKLCYLYEKCGYVATGKEENLKCGMTIAYYKKLIY